LIHNLAENSKIKSTGYVPFKKKHNFSVFIILRHTVYRLSQKWRTNYLLLYRGCLNVHEKNMEKNFQTKKSIFIIIIINGNIM
jgi:hypothetical protein